MPTYEEMRKQGFYPLDNSNAPAPTPATPTIPTPSVVPTAPANTSVPSFTNSIQTGTNPAYQPAPAVIPTATPSVNYADMAKQGFYPAAPKSEGSLKKVLDATGLTNMAKDFYQSYMNTTADTWNQVGGVAKLVGLHSVSNYSKNLAKGYRKTASNVKTGNSFADTIYKTMGSLVSPQTAAFASGAAVPAALAGAVQAIGQGGSPEDVAKNALTNVILSKTFHLTQFDKAIPKVLKIGAVAGGQAAGNVATGKETVPQAVGNVAGMAILAGIMSGGSPEALKAARATYAATGSVKKAVEAKNSFETMLKKGYIDSKSASNAVDNVISKLPKEEQTLAKDKSISPITPDMIAIIRKLPKDEQAAAWNTLKANAGFVKTAHIDTIPPLPNAISIEEATKKIQQAIDVGKKNPHTIIPKDTLNRSPEEQAKIRDFALSKGQAGINDYLTAVSKQPAKNPQTSSLLVIPKPTSLTDIAKTKILPKISELKNPISYQKKTSLPNTGNIEKSVSRLQRAIKDGKKNPKAANDIQKASLALQRDVEKAKNNPQTIVPKDVSRRSLEEQTSIRNYALSKGFAGINDYLAAVAKQNKPEAKPSSIIIPAKKSLTDIAATKTLPKIPSVKSKTPVEPITQHIAKAKAEGKSFDEWWKGQDKVTKLLNDNIEKKTAIIDYETELNKLWNKYRDEFKIQPRFSKEELKRKLNNGEITRTQFAKEYEKTAGIGQTYSRKLKTIGEMSSKDILKELPQKYKDEFYNLIIKKKRKLYSNVNPQLYSEESINKLKKEANTKFKTKQQLKELWDKAGKSEPIAQDKISQVADNLQKYNAGLKGSVAQKGLALSGLSKPLLNKVASGDIPEDWGIALGDKLKGREDDQRSMADFLDKQKNKKSITPSVIEQFINELDNAPKKTETANTLFGIDTRERSLLFEKAKLKAYAIKKLSQDKRLFTVVSNKAKAGKLETVGNKINAEANKLEADKAKIIADTINDNSIYKGKINDVLNEYSQKLSDAKTKAERSGLYNEFYGKIKNTAYDSINPKLKLTKSDSALIVKLARATKSKNTDSNAFVEDVNNSLKSSTPAKVKLAAQVMDIVKKLGIGLKDFYNKYLSSESGFIDFGAIKDSLKKKTKPLTGLIVGEDIPPIPREMLKESKPYSDAIKNSKDKLDETKKFFNKQVSRFFDESLTEGTATETAKAILARGVSRLGQLNDSMVRQQENARNWWRQVKDATNLDFMDSMEHGKVKDYTANLPDSSKHFMNSKGIEYRARLDNIDRLDRQHDIIHGYVKDYLPHSFENTVEEINNVFSSFRKHLGTTAYKKTRFLDFIKYGIEHGLKLKSYNPEELVLAREYSTHANIAKINALKDMQKEGIAIVTPRMSLKYSTPLQGTMLGRIREYGKRTSPSNNIIFGKLNRAEIKHYAPELLNDKSFVSNFTAVKTTVGLDELVKSMNISKASLINKIKSDWYNYKNKTSEYYKERQKFANLKKEFQQKNKGWVSMTLPDGKLWYVHPDAAREIETIFDPKNLWNEKSAEGLLFRSVMAVKNTFLAIKLGLSLFHFVHISTIKPAAESAYLVHKLINGKISGKDFAVEIGKTLTFLDQYKDVKLGWSVKNAMQKPLAQLSPDMRTNVGLILDGGGSTDMSAEFKIRSERALKQALQDKSIFKTLGRSVPAFFEFLQKPILDAYVPSLKAAMYLKRAKSFIEENPDMSEIDRIKGLRKRWQMSDNQFGMMVYKTMFWKKEIKQIGQASLLSLGWQLGFIRSFAGAGIDAGKMLKNIANGTFKKSDITYRMLYAPIYTMYAATVGSLITKVFTGQYPTQIVDAFYPRTGGKDKNGRPNRFNTPFFTREPLSFINHWKKEGVVNGTEAIVLSKANPVLRLMYELKNNKDYFNYEIASPHSGILKQTADYVDYIFKQYLPISVVSSLRTKNKVKKTMSFAGFTPAPKYITETPLQSSIFSLTQKRFGGGIKSRESEAKLNARHKVAKLFYAGKQREFLRSLQSAQAKGYMPRTVGRVKQYLRNQAVPSYLRAFKRFSVEDQTALWGRMNNFEKLLYFNFLRPKLKFLYHKQVNLMQSYKQLRSVIRRRKYAK